MSKKPWNRRTVEDTYSAIIRDNKASMCLQLTKFRYLSVGSRERIRSGIAAVSVDPLTSMRETLRLMSKVSGQFYDLLVRPSEHSTGLT